MISMQCPTCTSGKSGITGCCLMPCIQSGFMGGSHRNQNQWRVPSGEQSGSCRCHPSQLSPLSRSGRRMHKHCVFTRLCDMLGRLRSADLCPAAHRCCGRVPAGWPLLWVIGHARHAACLPSAVPAAVIGR